MEEKLSTAVGSTPSVGGGISNHRNTLNANVSEAKGGYIVRLSFRDYRHEEHVAKTAQEVSLIISEFISSN